jgi:glycosyltransferase involved in cell wall biosynthesis
VVVDARGGAAPDSRGTPEVEVSFVLPCLNEAETLGGCIEAAQRCIRENGLAAEVVVADNGSTDGSRQIADRLGARVVPVAARGYGSALMGGLGAARGKYLIMGDADESYDFGDAMKFVTRLRAGDDLVMGNRFRGAIMPGAMPTKNRYVGNPVLTWIGRILFKCPVSDFHCGLRAFTKSAYELMDIRATGMEFASEIVVKATLRNMRISEVPITLYKDGRSRSPHLRPWRDGWRHLRFMLCLSPRWTLFVPGAALMLVGLVIGSLVASGPLVIGRTGFDVHTLIAASLALIVGYMWITTALAMRFFGLTTEIGPPSERLQRLFRIFTLERGLLAGGLAVALGVGLILWLVAHWARRNFGELDVRVTIRPMIVGSTLIALGVQTVLMSLVYSMLGLRHESRRGRG